MKEVLTAQSIEEKYRLRLNESFSITLEKRQELYDREFDNLMEKSKEELVELIIGRRPII